MWMMFGGFLDAWKCNGLRQPLGYLQLYYCTLLSAIQNEEMFFFFFISHVTSYISLTYCFVIYFCHIKEPSSAYLITDKDHKSFTPVHYVARKGQAKVDLQTRCVVYDIK